jgi:thymidylate synthase
MQHRYRLSSGFPVVTTKRFAWKACLSELLWFIEGSRDNNRLKEILNNQKTIWEANAEAGSWKPHAQFPGDVGRIYGVQWRSWQHWSEPDQQYVAIDQLKAVIENIKAKPYSRRHVVTAWNPGELDQMALPPCHIFFQFYVDNGKLSMQMYQRSCDMFLGVPFNISSYALLLHMVAQVTEHEPGDFIHTFGDAHIYHNHFEQVKIQLSRDPYSLPELWINPKIKDIDAFTMKDFKLINYQFHKAIKGKMSV